MSTLGTPRPLPRPLHLVSNTTGTSGLPTPLSANDHGPLSAPLSQNKNDVNGIHAAKSQIQSRRPSSISYNTVPSKAWSPASGLERRSSLDSKLVLDSEGSRGDENAVPKASSQHGIRETEPVTLAEKHVDLLRFIAQKESKCLELRTQLAQHEADLLVLKRKWERIVSKGVPSARIELQAHVGSDVLGGIREGVQSGLGKVFAVLEPSMAGPSSMSQPDSKLYSQRLENDSSTSSGKRPSISTASTGSTHGHSSLSRSSSSSLFDELSSPDRQSSTSSLEGKHTAGSNRENDMACPPRRRFYTALQAPSSSTESPVEVNTESSTHKDDQSSMSRGPGFSANLSRLPSQSPASVSPDSLSKQMSNWVPPGLNKKWEELKGSETLSKQSKRASILLNDVLAVLAPPVPRTSSTTHRRDGKQLQPSSPHSLDSALFDSTKLDAGSAKMSSPLSPSLLDEKNECNISEILQPQVMAPGVPTDVGQTKDAEEKDEEEWNW